MRRRISIRGCVRPWFRVSITIKKKHGITGHPKKKVSAELFTCLFVGVCWLFFSGTKHKQWMTLWFLTCPMPNLSGRIKFDSFSKTWNFFTLKIPIKYSKNSQNFAMSKNASNVLIVTCWTLCKKLHLSRWSSSRYTFFGWPVIFSYLKPPSQISSIPSSLPPSAPPSLHRSIFPSVMNYLIIVHFLCSLTFS